MLKQNTAARTGNVLVGGLDVTVLTPFAADMHTRQGALSSLCKNWGKNWQNRKKINWHKNSP